MKNLISILSFITIFSLQAFSQSVITPDSRLSAAYTSEYLTSLNNTQPQELQYLNWYLDNSYTIVEAGIEKCSQMPALKSFDPNTKTIGENVESIDEGNFNILLYSFERKYDKNSYYRIGDTGYAIVFESHKKLAENFNKYQNEN
jgi:hypothetical protein